MFGVSLSVLCPMSQCQDACQRLMTSQPQEQAAKIWFSGKDPKYLVLCTVEGGVGNMTDHAPMKLDKHYTCWIERRWSGFRPLNVQCLNST